MSARNGIQYTRGNLDHSFFTGGIQSQMSLPDILALCPTTYRVPISDSKHGWGLHGGSEGTPESYVEVAGIATPFVKCAPKDELVQTLKEKTRNSVLLVDPVEQLFYVLQVLPGMPNPGVIVLPRNIAGEGHCKALFYDELEEPHMWQSELDRSKYVQIVSLLGSFGIDLSEHKERITYMLQE